MKAIIMCVRFPILLFCLVSILSKTPPEAYAEDVGVSEYSLERNDTIRLLGLEYPCFLDAIHTTYCDIESDAIRGTNDLATVLNRSISWIEMIIRKDWIAGEIRNHAFAVKNTNEQCALPDVEESHIDSNVKCLVYDYEIRGHRILITDAIGRVSFLADLSESEHVAYNRNSFIEECLKKFTTVKEAESGRLLYNSRETNGLCYGSATISRNDALDEGQKGIGDDKKIWWNELCFMTDGSFFFVSIDGISRKISVRSGVHMQTKGAPIRKRFTPSSLPVTEKESK